MSLVTEIGLAGLAAVADGDDPDSPAVAGVRS